MRRSSSTDVVERVKLERQKIEADFCASNVFEKSIHPRPIPGCVRPREQLVFETLQARASDLQWRLEFCQTPGNSTVQCCVILRRNPLSIGFFAQLDSFQAVIPTQQVLDLSDSILGCVVQHAYRNEHGQVVSELAAQDEIQSGLLCAVVDVFGAMPWIGRRRVNNCLAMPIGCVTNVIMKTSILTHFPEIDLANREA